MPKKTTQKAPAKKATPAKKAPARKATPAKKAVAKKATPAKKAGPTKKAPAKKAAPTRKAVAKKSSPVKKAPARKAAPPAAKKTTGKKPPARKPATKTAGKVKATGSGSKKTDAISTPQTDTDEAVSSGLSLRLTAALSKVSSTRKPGTGDEKRSGPDPFTLDDVREIIKSRTGEDEIDPTTVDTGSLPTKPKTSRPADDIPVQPRPRQSFGAVSMADILGFNPLETTAPVNNRDDESIPKKLRTFYNALIDLREGVEEGLMRHSQENLGISNRDDSGDLSGYGQHMADAGTENFERDFALSMVSSEQEALQEIDDAIARIRDGSYGVCEITGKPISRDRLKAVPFARYSIEGQQEIERNQRRRVERGGIFGTSSEDLATFSDEDADE